jgi:hypothetical protein
MKKIFVAILAFMAVSWILFAQGSFDPASGHDWRRYNKPYDLKAPPPVGLSEAYALTLSFMGPATNNFYCVSASCTDKTRSGLPGWTFAFFNTNAQMVRIEVSFDKEIFTDSPSAKLIGKKEVYQAPK